MIKFIHAADIHLDSPLRGLEKYEGAPVDEIQGAVRVAFKQLIDRAIEEQVAFILIAGDLYDGDLKDYNTALYFSKQMGRLRNEGIKVFIVSGNHDAESKITKQLSLPENVKVFSTQKVETVILEEARIAIHGMSYKTPRLTEDISSNYPELASGYFNIGLLHTNLGGNPSYDNYAPSTIDGLKSKHYDYWALGHIHKQEIIHRDPWIVYPGNIQGRHIKETGSKGCFLISLRDRDVTSVDPVYLDVLRWVNLEIDVSGQSEISEFLETIRTNIENEIQNCGDRLIAMRLTLNGVTPLSGEFNNDLVKYVNEIRAVANDLYPDGLWLEKVLSHTKTPKDESRLQEEDGPIASLRGLLDSLSEDERSKLAQEASQDLFTKFPELTKCDDGYDYADSELVLQLFEDAKQLIMANLARREVRNED